MSDKRVVDTSDLDIDKQTAGALVTGVTSLGRISGYAVAILTVMTILFGGLWNLTVHEPLGRLEHRVDKLEAGQEEANKQIANTDKNVAVILERTKRADDNLESIRRYFENPDRK